jgi:sugar phosphate isomerase/epimerase
MVKLAVSNLAWPAEQESAALALLTEHGVTGVEVVPTRLAPSWDDLTPPILHSARTRLDDAGLRVPALQSLFFGLPEHQILGDDAGFASLVEQLRRVAAVAQALGAPVAVLGAARNRRDCGLPEADAWSLGADRLRAMAESLEGTGLTLALEPVPEAYGCGFITTAAQATRMVRRVDHPALRLHLDSANAHLAHEAIAPAIAEGAPDLAHFHASQPCLGDFAAPLPGHAQAAAALRACAYQGWVSVEMLDRTANPLAVLHQALTIARELYLSSPGW